MTVSQTVIDKIRKALSLAGDRANANESQNAMLLAQRLMAKHGLSASDIGVQPDSKDKKAVKGRVHMKKVQWWQKHLLSIIANNFRCYGFFTRGDSVGFLGLPKDVDIAVEVFAFANKMIKYHASAYMAATSGENRSRNGSVAVRNDYIEGYLQGLREKFEEQVAKESLALVLVKDEVVEDAFRGAEFKKAKPHTRRTARDQHAIRNGYADGRKFSMTKGELQ